CTLMLGWATSRFNPSRYSSRWASTWAKIRVRGGSTRIPGTSSERPCSTQHTSDCEHDIGMCQVVEQEAGGGDEAVDLGVERLGRQVPDPGAAGADEVADVAEAPGAAHQRFEVAHAKRLRAVSQLLPDCVGRYLGELGQAAVAHAAGGSIGKKERDGH